MLGYLFVREALRSLCFCHTLSNVAPPKGQSNNPHGRPKIGEAARVPIAARVAPETAHAIVAEAERRGVSRGALLDEIVATYLKRKLARTRSKKAGT